jgi:hypothetical protein
MNDEHAAASAAFIVHRSALPVSPAIQPKLNLSCAMIQEATPATAPAPH